MRALAEGYRPALFLSRMPALIGLTIKPVSDRPMQEKTFLPPFNSLLHKFLQVMSSRVQPGIIACQAEMPCLTISDKVSLPYQFCQEDTILWL